MRASQILDDQVVHVKRGRSNGLGFEPAFNSYFDFYLNSKYFGQPLLELEDVTLHLYLRKNLNDKNQSWKMPTIRQMMAKFGISQKKLMTILKRLEQAHLLFKESGVRAGQVNTRNDYILSDPIPTLNEFLEVAQEGLFRLPLWQAEQNSIEIPCMTEQYTDVSLSDTPYVLPSDTPYVLPSDTDQQTLRTKQTSEENSFDPAFEELRFSVEEKIFERFMNGARLIDIEEGIAVIGTPFAYAKDFIENRLGEKIKRALQVDSMRCVVLTG